MLGKKQIFYLTNLYNISIRFWKLRDNILENCSQYGGKVFQTEVYTEHYKKYMRKTNFSLYNICIGFFKSYTGAFKPNMDLVF